MKNLFHRIGIISLYGFVLLSCDNDPLDEEGNNALRITVQFQSGSREIAENIGEQTIALTFNKPALADGVITLKTANDFEDVFTSVPSPVNGLITIAIQKGDVSASLKVAPIDNEEKEGNRLVSLTLHNLGEHFISGTNKTLAITVNDDETSDPNAESLANFISQDIVLEEANTQGIQYQVHFSEAVAIDSEIKIRVASPTGTYGTHYVTEPAAENNVVTLPVTAGLRVISFRVKPVANQVITGELEVTMTISETSGSIRKGNNLAESLVIKDDELAQKPKGYEITAGSTVYKKFFEYDAEGRIARVKWENYNPYYTHGTETYHYDGAGQLIQINKYPGRDTHYEWSNGKIVKSNDVWDGVIHSYTDYAYDDLGNIAGAVSYHRQQDGSYLKGFFTIYFSFFDGNLYKSLTYQDTDNPEEPYLVSTRTYENYIDSYNPYPMSEVVPTIKMQNKLATTYRIEEGELDKTYHMNYEFRPDGLPAKRIATAPGDTQTAVYHYY